MIRLRLGRKKVKKIQTVLRGVGCYLRLLMLGGVLSMTAPARADLPVSSSLPVPCGAGCTANGGPTSWVTSGQAALSSSTNTLYVNQQSDKAILNWQSFNISAGNSVQFNQPSASSVALNRIYQADPSRIQGSLTANGQIYLINRNGFIFGNGAKVNVNSLTASTLNVSDDVFNNIGILQAVKQGKPVFEKDGPMGSVVIETGAELHSADGGRIMVLAPKIENSGKIETPNGQTILAASQDKVWLQAASKDDNLRGLLVEVGTGGDVRNLGEIIAKHGNITMMGFAVNQDGLVSATTTVNSNGSIKLVAHDKGQVRQEGSNFVLEGVSTDRKGEAARVEFGSGSRTEVLPELNDTTTAVDEQKQLLSQMDVVAKDIMLREGAQIVVPGGNVNLTATANPVTAAATGTARNDSRIVLESGSLIDVSGTTSTVLPMSRNELEIELRANELKDSPLQRNNVLRGKKVTIDIRKGTKIADIQGALDGIKRDIGERLAAGGTVNVASEGDVVMASGAKVDISGGVVKYDAGWMNTTKLVSEGKVYDISDADPNLIYDGILGEYTRKDAKWGVTRTWTISGPIAQGYYEDAYAEGKSAGTFNVTTSALRLDGQVLADATRGKYQRDTDHLPKLGTLSLDLAKLGQGGLKYNPATVKFAYASSTDAYDPKETLDPSKDITIDPRLLELGGIGHLILNHNGKVDVPEGIAINLPAGGELKISSSGIKVGGSITVPAGTVSLGTAQLQGNVDYPITLGEHGHIDVSGLWVNDYALANAKTGTEALVINGGTITLNAHGDLKLAAGSIIDADGGAFVDAQGKLRAGNGGTVNLTSRVPLARGSEMALAGDIHAYAVGKGGTLNIEANALRISQSGSAAPGELLLTPEFFQQGGFNSYTLISNLDGITVAADTIVKPQASTLVLEGDYFHRMTGSDISKFSTIELLPDDQRRPVDLSLKLSQSAANIPKPAHFSVETGSRIEMDPQAKLTLSSDHSIDVNGVLSAPAGQIALKIGMPAKGTPEAYYDAAQGIHLGADAQLLAPGTTKLTPNTLNQPMGEILSGGNISLTADRGHIVMQSGSEIDVSGTAATLLVRTQNSVSGGSLQTIASDAGTIHLSAAEGMVLAGIFSGHAGGSGAAGGELSIAMNANNRGMPDVAPPAPYLDFPYASSTVTLTTTPDQVPESWQPGKTLPQTKSGQAVVSSDAVESGGFDSLTLAVSDQVQRDGTAVRGQINLEHANLDLKRSIILDAPLLNNKGGDSHLSAAYVALANNSAREAIAPKIDQGFGQLEIAAQHIDLVGNVTLQGWQQSHLSSEGDIRLIGLLPVGGGKDWHGSLNSFSDLELQAAQIYPVTLTQFDIGVTRPDGNLKISLAPATASSPVLSAGGRLTLKAANIDQGGVVKAPFGDIEMIATKTLVLSQGSLTSTSGAGQIIPFGRTELGIDWVYPVDAATKLVFGEKAAFPTQNLNLKAPSVIQQAEATIDVSGGGDLYAYEFVPGPGGSRDTLAMGNAANSYAILPWMHGYGPNDPLEFSGTNLKTGDSIHLAAGSALPAGDYMLLPARYALLPGAYLVTKQAGTQDFGSDLAVKQTDGSVLVGGYRSVAGTDIHESRWSGYTVAPGSIARTRSEYQDSFANDFFTRHAITAGVPAPLLPQDAGRVAISVTKGLQLDGKLLAQSEKGRGARVDLEAEKLAIVSQRGADDGTVQVTATNLNALGAESVLLGGHRTETGKATELTATATKVTVKSGAQVSVHELLLAASDEVKVESGAELTASGQGAVAGINYTLHGDGALLQISSGAASDVQRTGAQGKNGNLRIETGATLTATQSMFLESSRDTVMNGTLNMHGGNLSLGARHISLGDTPAGTSGLVLTQEQLSGLQVDHLNLNSRETVDLYGNVNLNMKDLTLSAAGLIGYGTAATSATIVADVLELKNTTSAKVATVADAGHLAVTVGDLRLGSGNFKIDGFSSTEMSANREVHAAGTVDRSKNSDKTLNVDGDVMLRTPVIVAEAGSDTTIATSGKLNVLALSASQPVDAAGLGARLSLEGNDVSFGTSIQLPSGDVRLTATAGDVHLMPAAVINVSGRTEQFSDKSVATPAGSVTLQSAGGSVILDSGSTIAMKTVTGGDAGILNVSAASGVLILNGSVDAHDENSAGRGTAKFDIGTFSDFSELNRTLNSSGFGGERELRQRHGDMIIAKDDIVNAQRVHFTADNGALEMSGQIVATAEKGGVAILEAKDDVHLHSTARIDARATGTNEAGGHVLLATSGGKIVVDAADDANAAVIDVSGTRSGGDANLEYVGGKVELRAPRVGNNVAVASLAGKIRGAESISVEAFRGYQSTIVDAALQDQVYADTADYMSHAAAITSSLGMTNDPRFHLRPGVEISSSGDLTVMDGWDFAARDDQGNLLWRFGNEPGVLTLRAAKQLTFNQGIQDGIETANIQINPDDPSSVMPVPGRLLDGDSWGFRFAGGADIKSADSVAVTEGAGKVRLDEGVQIHTGSGDIRVASGNDLEFADTGSAIFSAGRSAGYGSLPMDWMAAVFPGVYPVRGGDVTLNVTGNIKGAGTNQLISDWLHRMGNFGDGGHLPTAWAANFTDTSGQPLFNQNVGVFGGGGLKIHAGGNIDRLSAVVPTTGRPDGQYSGSFDTGFVTNKVTVLGGGGALDISAGGNINGGIFFVDGGEGKIKAGKNFQADNNNQAPILAMGDANFEIQARNDLTIGTVLNSSVLPLSAKQKDLWTDVESNFFTYTESSGVKLSSLAGDITLRNKELITTDQYPSLSFGDYVSFLTTVYPGNLNVAALGGNIFMDGSFKLFPSHQGNLTLLADGNISMHDAVTSQINVNMSDADIALLPKIQDPRGDSAIPDIVPRLDFGGVTLNHAAIPVHNDDKNPVYIMAREGDLRGSNTGRALAFYLPKQARLSAGRDIRNISLSDQNLTPTDLTQLKAGRDISYDNIRNPAGQLGSSSSGVTVAGPGDLALIAGRDVDLGTANGVVTTGNTLNRALSENGANITIEAGINKELDYAAYLTHYLQIDANSRSEVAAAVRQATSKQDLGDDEAVAMLHSLSQETQRHVALIHYFGELTRSALEAAKGDAIGYQRGYDAIAALFGDNTYHGDVRLYFSRIHTVDGGDINMLVPGGLINAGLAVTEGFKKKPSELGIVAQRSGDVNIYLDKDMLVNQSRVFALDGGDIVIWSQHGNIDAGRGAKSAISAPPPIVTFDDKGTMKVEFPAAIAGSGIRGAATSEGVKPGSVTLAAPSGVVIANDAGIDSAGALVVAATAVLGADNISAAGGSVGVPSIEPPSVSAGVANAGNAASNASKSNQDLAAAASTAPLADSALAFLEVEVLGFGTASNAELAGTTRPEDVAVGAEDSGKLKQENKGNRLAKDKDDGLPKAADAEAKPAGRVAATPAE